MGGASTSDYLMKSLSDLQPAAWPFLIWLSVALAGIAAIVLLVDAVRLGLEAFVVGPILVVGLMGVGMVAAAAARHLWVGFGLALLTGAGFIGIALMLGMSPPSHPFSLGAVLLIASISFAARGALFARSVADKGWLIAVFVVTGEAAILFTASVRPDVLPDWLLAPLPAQWANMAIYSTLIGTGTNLASSELVALSGTAVATLIVVWLWPRRWPYLLMFTTWLGLSTLVWHRPASPMRHADLAAAASEIAPIVTTLPCRSEHRARSHPVPELILTRSCETQA